MMDGVCETLRVYCNRGRGAYRKFSGGRLFYLSTMSHADALLFCIYIFLGPLPWLGMFAGYALAASRMNRLKRAMPLPEVLASVTVLIPAKDEGREIGRCIRSVLGQDYPQFEVLAIDDRSADDTGVVLDRLAEQSGKLRVMHIPVGGLPSGWLGKCHALAVGAATVSSEWLLFVDSDVRLEPQALTIALSNAVDRKYDAVSILTKLECHTFWEKLVLPLAAAAWTMMFAVSATNDDDRKEDAAANGQFFLVRRSAYEKVGGHSAVRDQITEDVELMRRLKANEFRTRFLFGDHLATTRMHATLNQMLHGWGRIYSGTSRRRMGRIAAALVLLPIFGLSVYPMLVVGLFHPIWLAAAATHFVLMTAYLGLIYGKAGQSRKFAILFPIGCGVLMALLAYALRMCRTGRVLWRDTQYESWQPHGNVASGDSENH
jgi:chlorobactene glucosyltransferase